MSNGVPPPSTKPVWPIVVACLVLVVGIMVAAVFVGMNLSDSDDNDEAAARDPGPSYAADDSGAERTSSDKQKSEDDKQETSDPDESDSAEKAKEKKSKKQKSPEPSDDSSGVPEADDPRLDCGNAATVLTTRTAKFGASICRDADGDHIYRGMSVKIDGSLVLDASLDKATDTWVATNKTTEYIVDANTGAVTIRNTETGEVYGSEASIEFHSE